MTLYRVRYDSVDYYVEAKDFGDAHAVWLEGMKPHWGDEWMGDEMPDEIAVMYSDVPVIRREALRPEPQWEVDPKWPDTTKGEDTATPSPSPGRLVSTARTTGDVAMRVTTRPPAVGSSDTTKGEG